MTALPQERFGGSPSFNSRYSADPEYLYQLGSGLLLSAQPANHSSFACYQLDGTDERSNLGRSVELSEFYKAFGNTEELMQQEYGPYDKDSTFFVVMDRRNAKAAGTLRVISDGENGLKTLNDIEKPPLSIPTEDFLANYGVSDLAKCWDIGTMAVSPEYRSKSRHIVSSMLYRAMHLGGQNKGIEHYVITIDKRVYDNIKELGVSFDPINDSEPFPYLGSKLSVAAYGHAPDFIPNMKNHLKRLRYEHPLKAQFIARHVARLANGYQVDNSMMFEH